MRVDSLREMLHGGVVDAKTTLVLDLDRTLISMRGGMLPTDRTLWPGLTQTVEPNTAQVVARLQQCGVPIFGLTARGLGNNWQVAELTEKQLHHVDVDLSRTSPVRDVGDYRLTHRAAARGGVVYCGQNEKGDVLAQIHHQHPMGRTVVVDDNLHNFTSLILAARALKYEFTGVYYRHDLSVQERAADLWDWLWCKSWGMVSRLYH